LFWSLSYVKSFNDDATIYLKCSDEQYNAVYDLLISQPYIANVCKYTNQSIDVDLDHAMRKDQDKPLLECYYSIDDTEPNHEPWLYCNDTITLPDNVTSLIYRNTNYRNRLFDWKYFIHKENIDLSRCCFVGSEHEYIQFTLNVHVPRTRLKWFKTETLTHLLAAINTADHFYCHAGLPLVLAHGLGKNMTIENGARMNNMPITFTQNYLDLPINMHNVLKRDNCVYYEQYNRNTIETV
jgi:hypothetical protein